VQTCQVMNRPPYARWLILALVAAVSAPVLMASPAQNADASIEATAIAQFDAAIARYMTLRQRLLEEKIPGPTANSTAAQLNQASDALAAAIQRARPKARPGELFVGPMAPVLKRRIDDVVRRDQLGPALANIDDEDQKPVTPAIHLRFPAASQMATMPPSLLAALPPLPKALEYRIVGQYLVLRDVEAALILDYIPAVIPR
jgi:hypothetical protein